MGIERVSGDVEPEHGFFLGKLVATVPGGDGRKLRFIVR